MVEYVTPFPEWTAAFVAAESEGREVELFAAILGGDVPVRPEWACIRCYSGSVTAPEVPGVGRYVPRHTCYMVLCDAHAAEYGAR